MHNGLYMAVSEVIASGKIGAVKMIRIHKNEPAEDILATENILQNSFEVFGREQPTVGTKGEFLFVPLYDMKQAIKRVLHEDIEFILRHCGGVAELYAKTVGYKNSIIALAHNNKCISHIALNFCGEGAPPVFRCEIAGTEGLIDYDSDKKKSISGTIRCTDSDASYGNTDFAGVEPVRILDGIFKSFEEKRSVRL